MAWSRAASLLRSRISFTLKCTGCAGGVIRGHVLRLLPSRICASCACRPVYPCSRWRYRLTNGKTMPMGLVSGVECCSAQQSTTNWCTNPGSRRESVYAHSWWYADSSSLHMLMILCRSIRTQQGRVSFPRNTATKGHGERQAPERSISAPEQLAVARKIAWPRSSRFGKLPKQAVCPPPAMPEVSLQRGYSFRSRSCGLLLGRFIVVILGVHRTHQ